MYIPNMIELIYDIYNNPILNIYYSIYHIYNTKYTKFLIWITCNNKNP